MSEVQPLPGLAPAPDLIHWRSLGQLEDSPEFRAIADAEFPADITSPPDEVSRRGFLSVVAASVALAGLASCRKPAQLIMPFNKRPDGYQPGIARHYATTLTRGGYGVGVLVRSNDGRPTKIEGNPAHKISMGGADLRLQGELLNLYDPARSAHPRGPAAAAAAHAAPPEGEPGTPPGDHAAAPEGEHAPAAEAPNPYRDFQEKFWNPLLVKLVPNQGSTLRFLIPPTASPTLLDVQKRVLDVFPKARFHAWEPIHRDAELAGSKLAFGKPVDAQVDYSKAEVVLSLDNDFLAIDGPNLRSARQWASRRKAVGPNARFARLYVVESTYSTTGTAADHRFRVRPRDVLTAALALAAQLGVGQGNELGTALQAHKSDAFRYRNKNWVEAVAKDLKQAGRAAAVVAGPRQPPLVHALAHAINESLGAVGQTVTYTATPPSLANGCVDDFVTLCRDIDAGAVEVLVCIGANPVYDAPADLNFAALLAKVPSKVHLGLHDDETGQHCDWHFNMAHELEAWGDARGYDGVVTLMQPLIAPLYGGLSPIEFLAWLIDDAVVKAHPVADAREGAIGHELVKSHWRTAAGNPDFESWWRQRLEAGVIEDTQSSNVQAPVNAAAIANAVKAVTPAAGEFEVAFRPDVKLWDGRSANNSWMQEVPDPLTKLVWDNAALISPRTAETLGVENGDLLSVAVDGRPTLTIPAWVLPGHAESTVTIPLGWGRRLPAEFKVARGGEGGRDAKVGFDAFPLRATSAQWSAPARVAKAGGSHRLVSTQDFGTMAGRGIAREATVATYQADSRWAPKLSPLDEAARLEGQTEQDLAKSLWPERGYQRGKDSHDPQVARSPYQWGMVIDLNACTGCSACIVACVAENNIPMVGKTQVSRNREMFWLRTDRYFTSRTGDSRADKLSIAEDPQVMNQPVPCMQCENAPCESVCPVAATTHSPDGLNDMVYNRCIGTRYCSNNCPYKVRRFNYFDYIGHAPETKKLAFNPDVTVRNRGVMEKCTYCVQRINGVRIKAKLEQRRVGRDEIVPACAQTCPTEAITFGDILDPETPVAKLKAHDLNYGVLTELNTKPRTTYLGRVRNPNPELSEL